MSKFLIALPEFKNQKGFCCPTILITAINKSEAIKIAYSIKPNIKYIGDIKEVNY